MLDNLLVEIFVNEQVEAFLKAWQYDIPILSSPGLIFFLPLISLYSA